MTTNETTMRAMLIEVVDDAVTSRFAKVNDDLHEIKTALTGNGFGANYGLVSRMLNVETALVTLRSEVMKAAADTATQTRAVAQEADTAVKLVKAEQEVRWAALKNKAIGAGIGAGLGSSGLLLIAIRLLGMTG